MILLLISYSLHHALGAPMRKIDDYGRKLTRPRFAIAALFTGLGTS